MAALESSKTECMSSVASYAPLTLKRRVRSDLETSIPKPYLARGVAAPDMEYPYGTGHPRNETKSVLQQHCAFFDQDDNGIIYPWETYTGFRQLGFGIILSLLGAFGVNLSLSYITLPGWIPSPFFPIYLYNIHKCKHGSDTETYDTEGRYMPMNFENIFSKYGATKTDKLSLREVWDMTEGNRRAFDPLGWMANKAEWLVLYFIARDEDGYLSKEAVRGCFDGSLFESYANRSKREI